MTPPWLVDLLVWWPLERRRNGKILRECVLNKKRRRAWLELTSWQLQHTRVPFGISFRWPTFRCKSKKVWGATAEIFSKGCCSTFGKTWRAKAVPLRRNGIEYVYRYFMIFTFQNVLYSIPRLCGQCMLRPSVCALRCACSVPIRLKLFLVVGFGGKTLYKSKKGAGRDGERASASLSDFSAAKQSWAV